VRDIGVHIRLEGSLMSAVQKAARYAIPFFQCFLVSHKSGKLIRPNHEDIRNFLLARKQFGDLYVHGSYWINLATIQHMTHRALHRELYLAKKLEFTHIVVHPGSAKGAKDKQEAIEALARAVNTLLAQESVIKLVLENVAHGGMSIGGDLYDFKHMLAMLDAPERVSFCIDTAHAYSYGYDIVDLHEQNKFIQLLDNTIGINSIALIHLNDTTEQVGSKMDRHEIVGKGLIGNQALKSFILDDRLKEIPVLMELPMLSAEEELSVLDLVRSWHKTDI